MRFPTTTEVAAVVLTLSSTAFSQVVSANLYEITYSFSVPNDTAASGSGDVYLQISGPTSYSWIGLGTGTSMSGSFMFIIYASSDDRGVTLSPRSGSGNFVPGFNPAAQVALLEGSGIDNGVMTANIKCSDCTDHADITGANSPWIYAALSGDSISSASVTVPILQHVGVYGSMSLDMTNAKNIANTNPFVPSSSSSSSATITTSSTSSSSSSTTSSPSSAGSGGGLGQTAIIGIGVGIGIIGLLLIAVLVFLIRFFGSRRSTRNSREWYKAELPGESTERHRIYKEVEGHVIHELPDSSLPVEIGPRRSVRIGI